jgi:hypothetical protein
MSVLRIVLALGLALTAAARAEPSDSTAARPDSSWRDLAPRLYIQDETWSDIDFVKTEVTFVNYVRDRTEADVQLTINCQTTGDGGREYCLTFLGLGSFRDINSVLKHTTAPDATPDAARKALVDNIRRGLVPYVARTGLRDALSIEFAPPTARAAVTDPWHNWVFSFSLDGWTDGDQSYSYMYYNACPRVSRVTEREKLAFTGGVSTTRRRFVLDTTVVTALSRSYDASLHYARKLTNHAAIGGYVWYNTSDYNNVRYSLALGPKLEYDFVPYSEYARHKVYVRFTPAAAYGSYIDTTLYNKLSEYAVLDEVVLGASLTRPWGTVELSADGSHYLHDITKNRLSLYGSVSLRVVAGLSVSLAGGYNFIHDQLTLRKAGATEEERLLRLREMATGYSYWTSLGVTYTFGSDFSNIVNPIF